MTQFLVNNLGGYFLSGISSRYSGLFFLINNKMMKILDDSFSDNCTVKMPQGKTLLIIQSKKWTDLLLDVKESYENDEFGRFYDFDEKKKSTVIRLYDSTFVKAYGKSKEPIDDVFRGYAAATGVMVFNDSTIEAVEVKCMSMGSEICEFLVKPRKKFNLTKKSVSRQLLTNKKMKRRLLKKS